MQSIKPNFDKRQATLRLLYNPSSDFLSSSNGLLFTLSIGEEFIYIAHLHVLFLGLVDSFEDFRVFVTVGTDDLYTFR